MAALWGIARPVHSSRANAYGGGQTVTSWETDPRYGLHPSNVAAKRAFLAGWLAGEYQPHWDDGFVRLQFDLQRRNIGLAKVVRISAEKRNP